MDKLAPGAPSKRPSIHRVDSAAVRERSLLSPFYCTLFILFLLLGAGSKMDFNTGRRRRKGSWTAHARDYDNALFFASDGGEPVLCLQIIMPFRTQPPPFNFFIPAYFPLLSLLDAVNFLVAKGSERPDKRTHTQ